MRIISVALLAVAVTCVLSASVFAAKEVVPKVFDLDASALDKIESSSSDTVWIVRFTSADGCTAGAECESFDKASFGLEGSVKFGNVKDAGAAAKHGVTKFPGYRAWTPALKAGEKGSFSDFSTGENTTPEGFVKAAVQVATDLAVKRAGGDKQKEEETGGGGGEQPPKQGKLDGLFENSEVLTLTDDELDTELQSGAPLFVMYAASWCGHCKNAVPHLKAAAAAATGVKVIAVDASGQSRHATKAGVTGFPTIKFYKPNMPEEEKPEDFSGPRTTEGFTAFLEKKAEEYGTGTPVVVEQMENQASFDKCLDSKLLCVVFVIPHVAFTGASGRNEMLEGTLGKIAKKFRARQAAFGWISGGDHSKFESAFAIEGNYPTVVAVSKGKKVYSGYTGQFNVDAITTHLTKLLEGRMSVSKLPKGEIPPMSKNVPLWDGKDYVEDPDE